MIPNSNDFLVPDSFGIMNFCRFCRYLHNTIGKLTCDAFPQGIPKELIAVPIFHNKPMLGQENDIVFKSKFNKKPILKHNPGWWPVILNIDSRPVFAVAAFGTTKSKFVPRLKTSTCESRF